MKKTECKIVQDLLPSYIDNLTSAETNSFIEQHIENCSECEEVLKDMQGDIQLEKINNSKKINALKKVKRRYRRITVISILIVILVIIIALYLWNNYRFVTDENGKIVIERFTFDSRNISYETNVIISYKDTQTENTIDGYRYTTLVLTINENNICTNTREQIKGLNEEGILYEYTELKNTENATNILTNVKISNNTIIYNNNTYNGKSKDKIIEKIKKNLEVIEIIEY